MNKKTFEWIWGQIEECIQEVGSEVDSHDKEKYKFCLTYENNTKNVIKNEYKKNRDELKLMCYSSSNRGDSRIDQHKIAACFCKSLIEKKVFSFNLDDDASADLLLSNYRLAYMVSLRIIYIYMLDRYLRNDQKKYYKTLNNNRGFYFPKTTLTHDEYNLGRIKTLALNDYYGVPFDVLTYADMMYWIEHYNRQIIEDSIEVVSDNPDDI